MNKITKNAKIVTIMTPCFICNCNTTKKYSFGDSYLCNICKDLTFKDVCMKLKDVLDDILVDESNSDFDEEDILEFLEAMIDEEEEKVRGELKE